jgi:hypothetical protein
MLHTGDKPYHPDNRRAKLRVLLSDLAERYGLTEEGVQHVVSVR